MAKGDKSLEEEVMNLLDAGKISPEAAVKMLKGNSQQSFIQTPIQTKEQTEFKQFKKILWGLGIISVIGVGGILLYNHFQKPKAHQEISNQIQEETSEEKDRKWNDVLSSMLLNNVENAASNKGLEMPRYAHLENSFAVFSPDTYYLSPTNDYLRVMPELGKSRRYWGPINIDLNKLTNPNSTQRWSYWIVKNVIIAGDSSKIAVYGLEIRRKGDENLVNLTKSEDDIAYEKKADELQERLMNGEQADPIYTTNSYGSRREWTNAGDLEILVTNYRLEKDQNNYRKVEYGQYIKKIYEHKLHINLRIRNNHDGRFAFNLGEIYLQGVSDTKKPYRPEGGIEYIPAGGVAEENYCFWVNDFSKEIVSIVCPKMEWQGESGYGKYGGKAQINLEKLPEMGVEE